MRESGKDAFPLSLAVIGYDKELDDTKRAHHWWPLRARIRSHETRCALTFLMRMLHWRMQSGGEMKNDSINSAFG